MDIIFKNEDCVPFCPLRNYLLLRNFEDFPRFLPKELLLHSLAEDCACCAFVPECHIIHAEASEPRLPELIYISFKNFTSSSVFISYIKKRTVFALWLLFHPCVTEL